MTKLDEMVADATTQKPAENAGAQDQSQPKRAQPTEPATMLVLDTTAKDGPRVHEQIVNDSIQQFTFMPGKGLPLSTAIAVKFLKHDGFKRVDAEGNLLEWRRAPKQPDELGAGEAIKVGDAETIARVDELSKQALLQRALEMPGGEKFTAASDRTDMVDFIVQTTIARRKAKLAKSELGKDDFVPEPALDEEAA